MRRHRVLSPIEAEFIARVQARFNAHDPGARSEFGRQVGLSPSSVTAVLSGDQVPHIEKWRPIADYLQFEIADLFAPVTATKIEGNNSLGRDPLRQANAVDSGSQKDQGEPSNAFEARLLAENQRLRQQIADYASAFHALADSLADVGHGGEASGKLSKTRTRKSGVR